MTINSFWLYYNTAYSYLPGQVSPYSWHCHKYVGTITTQGNKVGSTGYKNITLFLLRNILPSNEKALVYSFYCMTHYLGGEGLCFEQPSHLFQFEYFVTTRMDGIGWYRHSCYNSVILRIMTLQGAKTWCHFKLYV